ncbi:MULTISPECIES: hypothetical protein [Bacillus]|uniref:Uncharacterized protein n=1 Tax=Bacillus glycinifermentans TaxID=1664069 RepID=A0ABU6H9Z5_9BACI|nr:MULTISPECIES: hypothetical protein [Bacillus]MEC0341999.1 hypothetical protein [Bacillus sonorensis]MEC0457487.1 hypothetical protein [Bacillus sonorensis]MEC0487163.1 hypothetical protein [Bacillus glycinifermentans]MEC0530718.1 hypothetical protein [Bacillus sonorensis]UBF35328.1 hypothetical protein K9N56_23580 [Bacillus sp. PM8313]
MYKVINEKSIYYGYVGTVAYETSESVWIQLVKDRLGNRCYEGRVNFPKKDLEKIDA